MSEKENKIKNLIELLDDPDENIFDQIRPLFDAFGSEIIPILEQYREDTNDVLALERIGGIIDTIQNKEIIRQLKTWKDLGGKNLLKGAVLVAKFNYPELNEDKITAKINQLKQDIWIELNDHLTALEKIKIVNKVLFDLHGYSCNREDYYAPKNSFINQVLETKTGTPLSIGILYSIICQSLDIPVYGVNLPHHFVLAYQDKEETPIMNSEMGEPGILFYINPFNEGSIFGKMDVHEFLIQNKIEPNVSHFVPCDNTEIIKRMINNIIVAFEKLKKIEKMEKFKTLLPIF